jgi:carbonic anhydrase
MRIKRIDISRRGLVIGAAAGLASLPAWAEDMPGAEQAPSPRPVRRAPVKKAAAPAPAAVAGHGAGSIGPEDAMARLIAGNARYVADKAGHPHADAARRRLVAQGQNPFAVILACADSRVAPEIIFDQGLGDLFVVRVAGNVVDDAVLASIEYSVIHLGSTLIMALGHERCGAVKATMEALSGRGSEDDRDTKIGALANLIAPAVKAAPVGAPDPLDAAVSLNAAQAAAEIFAGSKPLRSRVLAGQIKIVSARYDLDDGKVTPTKGQA